MTDKSKTPEVQLPKPAEASTERRREEDFREHYRPDPSALFLHDLPAHIKKPGYRYKRVRADLYNLPWHLDDAQKKGWNFVYGMGKELAGRADVITDRENIRDDVFRIVGKRGTVSFWMEIPEERFQANQAEKKRRNDMALARSLKRYRNADGGITEVDQDFHPQK